MNRRKLISVILGLPVVVGCFLLFFILSHAAPVEKFNQISPGMTKGKVEGILGAPHFIRQDSAKSTVFIYGGFPRLKWCTIEVTFGSDGLVNNKMHDH